jgi:hypothetical protein
MPEMTRRSAIFALVSMALLVTTNGLAYRHRALPAVILGGVGCVLALVWFGAAWQRAGRLFRSPPGGTLGDAGYA